MKYQVAIDSPNTAIVKTNYLNKDFTYVFLTITFEPTKPGHVLRDGIGKYIFESVANLPPLPVGDPKRYTTIRQDYHRLNDINVSVKATSLKEACDIFAKQYDDVFEIIGKVPNGKISKGKMAAKK